MSNKHPFTHATVYICQLAEIYKITFKEVHISRSAFGELKKGAM